MLCVYCNKQISDSAKYCGHCSSPVPRCPTCGRVALKGIRYCEYDGTEIPTAGAKSFVDEEAIELDDVRIGTISESRIGGSFHGPAGEAIDRSGLRTPPLEDWEPGAEDGGASRSFLGAVPDSLFTEFSVDVPAGAVPEGVMTDSYMEAISETDLVEGVYVKNVEEVYEGIPEDLVDAPVPEPEKEGPAIDLEQLRWAEPATQEDLRPTKVAKPKTAPVKSDEQKPSGGADRKTPGVLSGQKQSGRNRVKEEHTDRDQPGEKTEEPVIAPEPAREVRRPAKPLCASCGVRRTDGGRLCAECKKKQKMRKLILSLGLVLLLLMLIPFLITSCLSADDDGTGPSGDTGDTPVITDPKATEEPGETEEPVVPEVVTVYQVIAGDLTWEEAEKACRERGGTLAVISSREEFEKISMLADQSGLTYLWLGARLDSDSDTWESKGWITGEAWTFENWFPDEPSGEDYDGTREYYLCMWNAKDDGEDIGWTFNDQRNDILSGPVSAAGKIGYVCEYQVENTQ